MRWLVPLLAVLVLLTPVAAALSTVHAEEGVSLSIGIPSEISYVNPLRIKTMYEMIILNLIYEPLVRLNASATGIIPWLAESYEVSDDGLTYTFHLRHGVYWHDGEPVTAQDVVYTFELIKQIPEWSKLVAVIENVTATDDYTVVIKLKEPYANFLADLTELYIVPKHVIEKAFADGAISNITESLPPQYLIGCGPFKVAEWNLPQYVKLEVVPTHFVFGGQTPEVKEITFYIVTDINQLAMKIASGELDTGYILLYGARLEAFKQLVGGGDVIFYKTVSRSVHTLGFHLGHPPLNDYAFRLAIAYAINVTAIVQKYYGTEFAIEGNMGFISPYFGDYCYYLPKERIYPYNPELAKKILDAAGYVDRDGDGYREAPDGSKISLVLLTRAPGDLFYRDKIAEDIKKYLEEVGIKVEVVATKDFWSRLAKGEYDMFITGWVPKDPITGLGWFTSEQAVIGGANLLFYSDSEYDMLYSKFKETGDKALAYKLEEKLAGDIPFIALYHPYVIVPVRVDKYKDWIINPRLYAVNYWTFIGSKIVLGVEGPVKFGEKSLEELKKTIVVPSEFKYPQEYYEVMRMIYKMEATAKTMAEVSKTLTQLASKVDELATTVSALEEKVGELKAAVDALSAITTYVYAILGITVLNLLLAIVVVVRKK